MGEGDIKALTVVADSGKNALLAAARAVWESQGLQVIGVALSRIAAENLQSSSLIKAQTLAVQEHEWNDGRAPLTLNQVVVVDGAEMIGLKQLERILALADKARGKVVLVGDSQQLEAMRSVSPLQSILDRVGPRAAP